MWQSASEPADASADLMTAYQSTRIKPQNVASPKKHSRKAVGIDYPRVFSQEEKGVHFFFPVCFYLASYSSYLFSQERS